MDGYELEAENYREVGEKLWQSMFSPDDSIEEWMVNSAMRATLYGDYRLRTDTVEHHVEDLIKAGFVSPVKE